MIYNSITFNGSDSYCYTPFTQLSFPMSFIYIHFTKHRGSRAFNFNNTQYSVKWEGGGNVISIIKGISGGAYEIAQFASITPNEDGDEVRWCIKFGTGTAEIWENGTKLTQVSGSITSASPATITHINIGSSSAYGNRDEFYKGKIYNFTVGQWFSSLTDEVLRQLSGGQLSPKDAGIDNLSVVLNDFEPININGYIIIKNKGYLEDYGNIRTQNVEFTDEITYFDFLFQGTSKCKGIYQGTKRPKAVYRGLKKVWPVIPKNIMVGGANGNYAVLNYDATQVVQEAKIDAIATNNFRVLLKLNNGNLICGGPTGNYAIISADGSYIVQEVKQDAIGTSNIRAIAKLNNGNVIIAGANGRYAILSADGTSVVQSYRADAIGGNQINTFTIMENGNIFVGGVAGNYAILSADGTSVVQTTKTDAIGTSNIETSVKMNNGNIFVGGNTGYYAVISADGSTIVKTISQDIVSTTLILHSLILNNGNILVSANSGRYVVLSQDGSSIVQASRQDAIGTTAIYDCKIMSDGNVIVGGLGGRYRVLTEDCSRVLDTTYKTDAIGTNTIYTFAIMEQG